VRRFLSNYFDLLFKFVKSNSRTMAYVSTLLHVYSRINHSSSLPVISRIRIIRDYDNLCLVASMSVETYNSVQVETVIEAYNTTWRKANDGSRLSGVFRISIRRGEASRGVGCSEGVWGPPQKNNFSSPK